MKRWTPIAAIVVASTLLASLAVRATAQDDAAPKIMQLKLDHAKGLLEGVAVADFARIERDARSLAALTQQAAWKAIDDPRYLDYSIRMRRALESMADQARAKNLDGAAYNYVQVTMTCVDCHKFIRDAARVDAGPPLGGAHAAAR